MKSICLVLLIFLTAGALPAQKALILDYEMYPPDFSNETIRRVAATGMRVDFRQYYPVLTQADLNGYRMIVLLSSAGAIGSNLQLPESEIPALADYVKGGGALVLGVPADPEAFDQLGPYNKLLAALGAGIQIKPAIADDDSNRYLSTMFAQAYFRTVPAGASVVLDRSTILSVQSPGVTLAQTSPTAYAITGLGRPRIESIKNEGGLPLVALAKSGKGQVLVIPRFTLNIGGFNGRIGVGPATNLDWIASSDRFVQNILTEMVKSAGGATAASETSLPAAPPANIVVVTIGPRQSIEPDPKDRRAYQARYRSTIRRDVYGSYLDHGIRAAWGDMNHDDAWLKQAADGFKSAGMNYIWAVGSPEQFVMDKYTTAQRDTLRHAWETFAGLLDGSQVGWTIGINYPGPIDRAKYAKSRGTDGKEIELLAPLDLRYWYDIMIPAMEEVAKFSLRHPSVKGVMVDYEMYGFEPIIFYPEAIGFEDVSYKAFLRSAEGHIDAKLLAEAAALDYGARYPWLRDHGLLTTFYLLLEGESEKLGRLIRERIHAINPNFIFSAYHAGLPYSWFYRGLIRGMSTPEMPMLWLSFQGLSGADVDRFWSHGQHMLNASAIMLGTYPIAQWKDAMMAGRRFHDGYWLNRFNWLIDDAKGKKSIEIPDGTHQQAWQALQEGNRLIDEYDRKK